MEAETLAVVYIVRVSIMTKKHLSQFYVIYSYMYWNLSSQQRHYH
jgi:hypothetical protein